jgi:AAA domain
VRAVRKTAQPRRIADRERRKRTESALRHLAAEAHYFYGSLADVVKEAYQTDTDENTYPTDRGEIGTLLTNVNAAIRTSLIPKFDEGGGEFLRVLKPTGTHGAAVPWVIYLRSEFRKSSKGSSDLDRENWFDQIRGIAGAVSIERKRYTSKYIELFETYMLIYMHNRGPSVFRSIAEMRRRKICSATGWFPDYGKAPWRKNRREIVERLENNSHLAAIALDPGDAWGRLKELARDAARDLPRVYLRQRSFEEQISRAPEMPYRQDVLQRIDDFVRKPETGPVLSLSGGPGTGKTSLVSGYLAQELRHGRRHPCFFVEMGKQQPATILGVLATEIRPSLINRTGFYGPETNESALALLNEALETLSRRYSRVVFIDGLDETEPAAQGESLSALLTQVRFPKHVRLVLSGRPTEDFRRLLDANDCSGFDVELIVSDAQNAAIRAYYEDHLGEETARSVRLDLLVHKSEGSFLYAELAVPEIKQALTDHGYYDVWKAPQGLGLRIQREWRRLCRGPLSRTQLTRLMACSLAHKGWPTLEELADFSRLDFPDTEAFFAAHEHLFVLDRSATPFLDPGTRLIGFRNSEVRRFLADKKILPKGMRRAHTCILDHYYQEGMPGWQTRLDEYSLQHLIEHARLSSRPTSALKILCREFVEKKRHIGVTAGALVVDVEAALEVAANTRDLSSLLKFCVLRGRLVKRDSRPVPVRFPFLRVDEDETALEDARSLGNLDDYLLTEVAPVFWTVAK